MTIFSKLPQDMLQHEIARFLDHRDVFAFNEVLDRNERVYKKFPKDYALRHHILRAQALHTTLSKEAQILINNAHNHNWTVINKMPLAPLAKALKKLFDFLADPINKPIFMYQKGLWDSQMDTINYWLVEAEIDPGNEFYAFFNYEEKEMIQTSASLATLNIALIRFERHITLNKNTINIY
jgi:hypothetical protein